MTLAATTTARLPTFWSHGACADLPAEWFHPERGESTKEAKRICATCPVRVDCLDWALSKPEKFGIWGGTSERERRRIRARLHRGEPDDDHTDPDPIIITLEEEPAVELTVVDPPAPTDTPANGASTRACDNCAKTFVPVRRDQRFHSKECARAWYSSHPKGASGKREPRIRRSSPAPPNPPRQEGKTPTPTPTPTPTATPDLQVLLGQLLAGCDHWHVEAHLGDVSVTVSRGSRP